MTSEQGRRERESKMKMLKPGAAAEVPGLLGDHHHSHHHVVEASVGGGGGGGGIDQSLLEKRLEQLRDTQESVQGLSLWCQANKKASSAIIETWLKVLKKSPVEKRLTLFYLANDVVQHAKRKADAVVVNQWGVAVQKATPSVRTPSSVSTAIARIFKIWEERLVYSKETIADLMSLLNNIPAKERVSEAKKPETYTASADKVASFQPSTLISKVKLAYRLKSHLGVTFRAKAYVHMELDILKASIKDRAHGMEVIQEIGQLVEQLRTSEAKLLAEVEERRKIVETAEVGIVHFENIRAEAKIVNSAYKNFTERVESTRERVVGKLKSFEEMDIDSSPVPSPPPEAPSPPPDDDDEEGDDNDFGIRPGNWGNLNSNSIRNDIMDALSKTSAPGGGMPIPTTSTSSFNHHHHHHQYSNSSSSSTTAPTTSVGSYDPSAIAAMTQFQQAWGGSGGHMDNLNFAAMIQHMLPSNNYMSSSSSSYESYQQPDVSSIPLPPPVPPSEPPHPPPPDVSQPPPQLMTNPYMMEADYSAYYKPTTNYGSSSEYTPYQPSTTPTGGGGYHPYNNNTSGGGGENTSNNSSQNSSLLNISPPTTDYGQDSRFYSPSMPSIIPTPTSGGSASASSSDRFDPMEIFSASLKNRKSNNQVLPNSSSVEAHQYHVPPPSNNIYEAFDPSSSSSSGHHNANGGGGGEEVEQYSPRKPGMDGFFGRPPRRGGGRGLGRGSSDAFTRGGHRGGGFLQSSPRRGFRGRGGGGGGPRGRLFQT